MTVDIASLVSDNLDIWATAVERKSGAGRGGGGKRVILFGIGRLRALIFDLAMRGKLVSQDTDDGHASALLHQVAMEGVKSAALSKGRARKQFQASDSIAPVIELPAGWMWVRLAEITRVIRGVTYVKSDASDQAEEGKICLLRGHNIQSTINFDALVFVPVSKVSEDQILQKGDIVIAMSSGSSDLVGKGAPFTGDETATFGAFCGVIRPFSQLIWPYLTLFCKTPLYRMQTRKGGRGIGIQNLSKGDLEKLQCPLPPLAEQQRIVAKVDELMALCDALEAESAEAMAAHQALVEGLLATLTASTDAADLATNWARLEAHFDTLFTTETSVDALKQTILELAVRGKLVRQDAGEESAQVLMNRIIEGAAASSKGAMVGKPEVPTVSSKDFPFEIPGGWVWSSFGQIATIRAELVQSLDYLEAIQIAPDIIEKGTGKLMDVRTVKDAGVRGPNSRFYSGQIIYSKIRPSLSKAVIAEFDGLCSADMYPLDAKIDVRFLLLLILSEPFLKQVRSAENRIKMPKLNKESLNSFLVPIPPLAEQRRIVAEVDELMALCDALKLSATDAATTQKHLADAIVERAAA